MSISDSSGARIGQILFVIALALTVGGLAAQVSDRVSGEATALVNPGDLPPITKLPVKVTRNPERAVSVLSVDDGTCEGGLGFIDSRQAQAVQRFSVPTICTQSGLEVIGLTSRVNSLSSSGFLPSFALHQGPLAPNSGAADITRPLTNAAVAGGACPTAGTTAGLVNNAVSPAAVVNNTTAFFAGVRGGGFFTGRDVNGPPAGANWLINEAGGVAYSPTALSGFGFP
ncbi:MAG: hypothetical protein GY719_25490, partial [bacterium]|nr:hypothetical protein [bacterium]